MVVRFVFPQFCKSDVEVRISRSIPESPLDFEITRVDCNWFYTFICAVFLIELGSLFASRSILVFWQRLNLGCIFVITVLGKRNLVALLFFVKVQIVPVRSGTSDFCRPRWFSWMRVQLEIRKLRVRPAPGRQHSFVEIDHDILSFPLIQEGQLSVFLPKHVHNIA